MMKMSSSDRNLTDNKISYVFNNVIQNYSLSTLKFIFFEFAKCHTYFTMIIILLIFKPFCHM